jgi:hypothetical protein
LRQIDLFTNQDSGYKIRQSVLRNKIVLVINTSVHIDWEFPYQIWHFSYGGIKDKDRLKSIVEDLINEGRFGLG